MQRIMHNMLYAQAVRALFLAFVEDQSLLGNLLSSLMFYYNEINRQLQLFGVIALSLIAGSRKSMQGEGKKHF